MFKYILIFLLFINISHSDNLDTTLVISKNNYTKEEKLLYLNIATTSALLTYGVVYWDYDIFNTKPHAQSEGWFEKNSKHGGADKFGHAYVGYFSSHMFSYSYESWGYSQKDAALNGALSSLFFTTVMEVGDSFSGFGLSYEDMISNTIGAILGYYTYKDKSISDKFDFRVEYNVKPTDYSGDLTTDYENLKYIFILKNSGFNTFKDSYLKYIEFYAGYYISGYEEAPYTRERQTFFGVGINLSELFNCKIFNYYQIPNSYLKNSSDY